MIPETFDREVYEEVLARGLSSGIGKRDNQVCIEAAICMALGLPHGDDPGCVAESVRRFKIRLNDARWSSPSARAKGLHDLGLAQLGSKGVVSDQEFSRRIVEKTIRVVIPTLFREVLSKNKRALAAAVRCEVEGSREAIVEARDAAAADAAAASNQDKYLQLSASLAIEILQELNSPGISLLEVK